MKYKNNQLIDGFIKYASQADRYLYIPENILWTNPIILKLRIPTCFINSLKKYVDKNIVYMTNVNIIVVIKNI